MFLFLNKKGQEEAPFELLIAVIVMGFVLIIGLQAMEQLRVQKCNNETEAKLEELKRTIETVISLTSSQSIDFRQAECYNPSDEKIRVTMLDNPRVCSDYCSSAASICTLLEYSNPKAGVYFKKCLNINSSTVFHSQDERGQCDDLLQNEKKILVNFTELIARGNYRIVQKITSDSFPHLCAYCTIGSGNCG